MISRENKTKYYNNLSNFCSEFCSVFQTCNGDTNHNLMKNVRIATVICNTSNSIMVILSLNDFVTDLLISTRYKRVLIGGGCLYEG